MLQSIYTLLVLALLVLFSCNQTDRSATDAGPRTIVFKHGKIAGDPGTFATPGPVRAGASRASRSRTRRCLRPPTSSTSSTRSISRAEARDFDVLGLDVIWVPEFARAGWLRDVTHLLATGRAGRVLPRADRGGDLGRLVYAIPWYIDAGVLYYRKDLLENTAMTRSENLAGAGRHRAGDHAQGTGHLRLSLAGQTVRGPGLQRARVHLEQRRGSARRRTDRSSTAARTQRPSPSCGT